MTASSGTPEHASNFSWKGAWVGAGLSVGAQAFFGTSVAVIAQQVWIAQGASKEQAAASLSGNFFSPFGWMSMLLTVFAGVFGGLISASYGRGRPMMQAAAAGALSLLFPLVMAANPMAQSLPFWYVVWMFGMPFASALLGGHFYVPSSPLNNSGGK